jgi:hypothetical protein
LGALVATAKAAARRISVTSANGFGGMLRLGRDIVGGRQHQEPHANHRKALMVSGQCRPLSRRGGLHRGSWRAHVPQHHVGTTIWFKSGELYIFSRKWWTRNVVQRQKQMTNGPDATALSEAGRASTKSGKTVGHRGQHQEREDCRLHRVAGRNGHGWKAW